MKKGLRDFDKKINEINESYEYSTDPNHCGGSQSSFNAYDPLDKDSDGKNN